MSDTSPSRPRVVLQACEDYQSERVLAAVRTALEPLGGMTAFVQSGQRVLLKPNLVRAVEPERAATTHPSLVAAVARLVIEAGGQPVLVESPGGPYSPATLRLTYRKTQMLEAAQATGLELNLDVDAVQVAHPDATVLHRLDLVKPLLDADVVINLPKLKTHNLTTLTMGVKNLFGLVPGSLKIGYHAKLQHKERFCDGLLDILTYVRPALTIMDAIWAMEGDGPSGGDPRHLGAILASDDTLALDMAATAMVGFAPLQVLTTRRAAERGLTSGQLEDLELLGAPLSSLQVHDFRPGSATVIDPGLVPQGMRWMLPAEDVSASEKGNDMGVGLLVRTLAQGWIWRQLVVYPQATDHCIACGYCVSHCPVGAITLLNHKARMDQSKCIRCYCCHELCPHSAITLKKPLLGRLLIHS